MWAVKLEDDVVVQNAAADLLLLQGWDPPAGSQPPSSPDPLTPDGRLYVHCSSALTARARRTGDWATFRRDHAHLNALHKVGIDFTREGNELESKRVQDQLFLMFLMASGH